VPEAPAAEQMTLRRLRAAAPPFHRHIARSKMLGKVWTVGDRVVVYEVVDVVPAGPAQMTEQTRLLFE